MSSWPFLFAAALAIWLLLKGPAGKTPLFVQKVCRIAIVFLAYCGVLYLLKWNPFWEWMLALGFENRNKAEGFLILVSTLVWLIATLRILLRSSRLPTIPAGADGPVHCAPRQEKARRRFSLTDLALFYFFTRK
ncbi:MAG TPA: hypothetical protein VNH18_12085 [Bryobacteraceae bacterium]|nr:hypothetical protein [Bryobacteraceae bacterium]HXJ40007.1 hypothetical protein [Bryobacteraceae bacterium]